MKELNKTKEPKISILVPVYNTGQFVGESLQSILDQTYRNIEIVVVSDASPGNIKEIIKKYQKEITGGKYSGKTIKYIEHEKNKGLYHTRLTAYSNATGEYIGIVDSDDYISPDFYRLLVNRAIATSSDIVIGETVFCVEGSRKVVHPMADNLNFEILYREEGINFLLEQEGQNFLYHVVWNKLYSKKNWEKAIPFLEQQTSHLIMTEDIIFSCVLWFFAETITKTKNAYYYYNKNSTSSTSQDNLTYKKINKNLSDIHIVFNFITSFFEKVGYPSSDSKQHIYSWRQFIAETWNNIIQASSAQKKSGLLRFLKEEIKYKNNQKPKKNSVFSVAVDFDVRFEEIKEAIISQTCKCVSFDLFDTLVWRPFYTPTDLFYLIDPYFKNLVSEGALIEFSYARVMAEKSAREFYNNKREVTLDEIYKQLQKKINISDEIIQKLKEKEIEYEVRYCLRRDSAFELFELAKYMGKKIFITSDMYLPRCAIEKILSKNGYYEYTELYISSEHHKSKYHGDLYEYFLREYNFSSKRVVHIGDNIYSDFQVAKDKGIRAFYFPRAVSVFMGKENKTKTNCLGSIFEKRLPFWQDLTAGLEYIGVRSFLSLSANKYFDNPFRSFNQLSDFNSDPALLGYYAVGMQNFAQLMWLRKNVLSGGYNNVVFVSRDGYLLKQMWDDIFGYDNKIKSHYLPISRRSIFTLMMNNLLDAHSLRKFINIYVYKPIEIVEYLNDVLIDSVSAEEILKKNKISPYKLLTTDEQYDMFIKVLYGELISTQKVERLRLLFKQTYNDMFIGKTCMYDIGYSGKPEAVLSSIFDKPIDTFFTYLNKDEGQSRVNSYGGVLQTFYNFRPVYGGALREMFISELGPSCVGYIIQENKLFPKFEKESIDYFQNLNIDIIHKQASRFVRNIFDIYGEDLKLLYYTDYYLSVPLEMFIHSAKDFDKNIFKGIPFEDNTNSKDVYQDIIDDLLNPILLGHNQKEIESIEYSSQSIDVRKRNIFIKAIYYILFNRDRLVLVIANKLRRYPHLYICAKRFYFFLKRIRSNFKSNKTSLLRKNKPVTRIV